MHQTTRLQRARVVGPAAAGLLFLAFAPAAAADAPPPPEGVRAPALTNVVPHLEWNASPSADSYRIRRSDGGCAGPFVYVGTKQPTFFNDGPVESIDPAVSGHTYGYVVRAVRDNEPSGDSACVTVTYDADPPAIATFAATVRPDGSVALAFAAGDAHGPITFDVRRGGPGDPPPASVGDGVAACALPAGARTCVDQDVVSGARYAYRLFATDAAGNSSSAAVEDVVPVDGVRPASPTGLVATAGNGAVTLAWSPPPAGTGSPDVAGYRVIVKPGMVPPSSVTDGSPACDVGLLSSACTVTGLENGQPVAFTVFARDEIPNWSSPAPGATAVATPQAGLPTPAPPVPPAIVQAPSPLAPQPEAADRQPPGRPLHPLARMTASGVTISWRNPADGDLDHVVVVRNRRHRPHSPSDGSRTNAGRRQHVTLPAERGERFHLALVAYDASGNASQATTLDVAVPVVLPVPGSRFSHGPLLSWKASPHAAYYNVIVTRAGRRVASAWPVGRQWRAPARLSAGLYRWYVWPGFGPKENARYGHLIGTSTFRISRRSAS